MFRNNRYGGLIAALLIFSLLAVVGIAAFQMGAASSAGVELVRPDGIHPGYGMHGFMFFPFFWGLGLLKLFFWLVLFGVFIRVLLRVAGFRGGPWGHGREERMKHWREMHDSWHAEHGPSEPAGEGSAAQ